MKKLIVFLAAMWSLSAWAANVSEVRLFEPAPGRTGEMLKAAEEARAIQEKLGATVFIGINQMGNMHYDVSFPDWGAWATYTESLGKSKEWAAFIQKYEVANPNAKQTAVLYLNSPVVAKTLPVTLVTSFHVFPGKIDAFLALAQEFVKVDTALGASPGISIDTLGNVHFLLAFDSYTSEAKFIAAFDKNAEAQALQKKGNQDSSGEAVAFYVVEQYTGP